MYMIIDPGDVCILTYLLICFRNRVSISIFTICHLIGQDQNPFCAGAEGPDVQRVGRGEEMKKAHAVLSGGTACEAEA
jgi:hypothetical protein